VNAGWTWVLILRTFCFSFVVSRFAMSELVSPHKSPFSEDIRHLCFEIANLEIHDLDKGELIVLNDETLCLMSMTMIHLRKAWCLLRMKRFHRTATNRYFSRSKIKKNKFWEDMQYFPETSLFKILIIDVPFGRSVLIPNQCQRSWVFLCNVGRWLS
jgi:hypothetical protein